jgi:hypothetical protein
LNPAPKLRRIIDAVARGIMPGLTDSHLFDLIAIRFGENAPIKVRTELVKAMTGKIVRRHDSQEMTVKGDYLHGVLDRLREVENVLKGPAV